MEQGSIRLERKSVAAAYSSSIQVCIDDKYARNICDGGVFYYKTSVGSHVIQLRMYSPRIETKDFYINILPHSEAVVYCAVQDNLFSLEFRIELLRYEHEQKNNTDLTSSQHTEKALVS